VPVLGEGVAVFFSEEPDFQTPGICQGWGVLDTFYVAAWNFSEPFDGIEFRVEGGGNPPYPFVILADITLADSVYGISTNGISLFWDEPVYAYAQEPVVIHMLQVMWSCNDCDDVLPEYKHSRVDVQPHPSAEGSFVEARRWPDGATIEALGLANIVCPAPLKTEKSTWGAIKALYR
jgi:hypothetical protein